MSIFGGGDWDEPVTHDEWAPIGLAGTRVQPDEFSSMAELKESDRIMGGVQPEVE